MARPGASKFKFRKADTVGAVDAEQDRDFLEHCFYETGDLSVLRDCRDPRRIVVGRTGSGKTALLQQLVEKEEHCLLIEPEALSLQYLSNSTILPYLESVGVDLDLFYRLLWRHIFAVELIKAKYTLDESSTRQGFLERIFGNIFGDARKRKAIEYLMNWGSSFWEETETRVREVSEKFESEIRAGLGTKFQLINAGVEGIARLSKEDRREIVNRAQAVVNGIQIRQLSEVIRLLADHVFSDPVSRYYVVIDKLDEKWVEVTSAVPTHPSTC